MRGGDGTMAPEQQSSSTPSWFTNLATRLKSAASNLTAKIRNFSWSKTPSTVVQPAVNPVEEPSFVQKSQDAAANAGEKVKEGFNDATRKLEEGYKKAEDTVGDFFNKDVEVPQLPQSQQNQQQMVMAGGKRRKMTKRRKMRGGLAAYNEYTVAQTASPVEGLKTAEPTYMINASLTNSLCGGKRRTKRGRKYKGRKTRGKKH